MAKKKSVKEKKERYEPHSSAQPRANVKVKVIILPERKRVDETRYEDKFNAAVNRWLENMSITSERVVSIRVSEDLSFITIIYV